MLKENGIPEQEDIERAIPNEERFKEGPVAIIECFEEIPCNPCYTFCSKGAIKEFASIHNLPQIDYDLCNGCGVCISHCPGLAIFVVDRSYSREEARVLIPWEMLPRPSPGQRVIALNRRGEELGAVVVERALISKKRDKTMVISLIVPQGMAMDVRSIKVVDSNEQ